MIEISNTIREQILRLLSRAIVADTVDERALKAIISKQSVQQALLENLKDLREKYERTEEDKHIG